jgi:hypothetical protein
MKFLHLSPIKLDSKKRFALAGAIVIIIAVIAYGGGSIWYFHNHLYPQAHVGPLQLGLLADQQAQTRLQDYIAKQSILVAMGDTSYKIPAADLGVTYNTGATLRQLQSHRQPWLSIMAPFGQVPPSTAAFSYHLDTATFGARVSQLIKDNTHDPMNAEIAVTSGAAVIVADHPGTSYDGGLVSERILQAIGVLDAKPTTILPILHPASVTAASLTPALPAFQQRVDLAIMLTYAGKQFIPTKEQLGSWLRVGDHNTVQSDPAKIAAYVDTIAGQLNKAAVPATTTYTNGILSAKTIGANGLELNKPATISALQTALDAAHALTNPLIVKTTPYTSTISGSPASSSAHFTYSYCVASKGVDDSLLAQFKQKAADVFADPRGWSLGGKISFNLVSSGCTFTLWLVSADLVPTFSSACSSLYSCSVGRNVIINLDRWRYATATWTGDGGNVNDYQTEVLNHETGHWLGLGHAHCSGTGQLAPTMQQQSIDLEGCHINWWPLAGELQQVRNLKGL